VPLFNNTPVMVVVLVKVHIMGIILYSGGGSLLFPAFVSFYEILKKQ
jgi:hypothetical protein